MAKRGPYLKGERRREEILQSAISVISEHGFHGATLRAVGKELGLEPAHISYYFGSREGLIRAVVERWDASNEPLPGGGDLLDTYADAIARNQEIRGIVQLYLAFAVEAAQEDHSAQSFFRDRFRAAVMGLTVAIARAQGDGRVRANIDPERAARRLVALADGLQLQWLLDADVDVMGEIDDALQDLMVAPTAS